MAQHGRWRTSKHKASRSPEHESTARLSHVVDLQSLDEDRLGEQLSVVWELEVGHTVTPAQGLPETIYSEQFDDPTTLVNADLRGIVTLNYDLMVEKAATETARPYTTGATEWDGGLRWFADDLDEDTLRVLKVHGSLNCCETRVVMGSPLPVVAFEEVEGNGLGAGKLVKRLDEPAIFGLNGKVSPYDPYPVLRSEFDRMLDDVELLVVVGFSFWDAHISAPIRRWLALDERRKIIVVDPYFNASTTPIREIVNVLCQECTIDGAPTLAVGLGIDRMCVLNVTAAEGVETLFGAD